MFTFPVVRKLYRYTIGPDGPVRSVAVRKIYRTTIGQLEPFRPESERTSAYLEQVQLFFAANDVPKAKQALGLLSAIGGKVYDLVSDLLAPEKPAEKSFDELKAILKAHCEVIAERFTFHLRNQHVGETVARVCGRASMPLHPL